MARIPKSVRQRVLRGTNTFQGPKGTVVTRLRHKKKAPGVVKGKNASGKTMILYKAPNNVPFPDVMYDKFRTESLFYINTGSTGIPGSFNALGEWILRVKALDIQAPFVGLGGATPVTAVGGSSTSTATPLDSSRLINANVYSSYQVLATKLEFEAIPANPTDTLMCALMPTNNNTPATYAQAMLEKDTRISEFRANTRTKSAKIYVDWQKFFGINKIVYNSDSSGVYSAIWSGSPTVIAFIDVLLQTWTGAPLTQAVGVRMKMTQYIKMWGFTQST